MGRYSYFEKVVEKNGHTTIPKGNMEYNQCTVPDCIQLLNLLCFPVSFSNIHPWPLVPFFEISLKNSELRTTRNFGIVACTFSDNLSRNSCIFPKSFTLCASFKRPKSWSFVQQRDNYYRFQCFLPICRERQNSLCVEHKKVFKT